MRQMSEQQQQRPPTPRLSKIYYLKETPNRHRAKSHNQISAVKPSVAHLSSLIQADTKKAVNRDLTIFSRGISLAHHLPVTAMSERAKRSAVLSAATPRRQAMTSYFPSQLMRMRQEEDFSGFLLSDLAVNQDDQETDRRLIRSEAQQRRPSKKKSTRNYAMQKGDFRTFLRNQAKKHSPEPAPKRRQFFKEIMYERVTSGWESRRCRLGGQGVFHIALQPALGG